MFIRIRVYIYIKEASTLEVIVRISVYMGTLKMYISRDSVPYFFEKFSVLITGPSCQVYLGRVSGVPAKMTCLWGVGSVKVHEIGYPNIFLMMKYLMAIFHAKGFGPTRVPSYLTIDIPRYHFFDMWKCNYFPALDKILLSWKLISGTPAKCYEN